MTEGQILYGLAQVDTVSLSLYLARTCSLQSCVISAVHTLPEVHRILYWDTYWQCAPRCVGSGRHRGPSGLSLIPSRTFYGAHRTRQ